MIFEISDFSFIHFLISLNPLVDQVVVGSNARPRPWVPLRLDILFNSCSTNLFICGVGELLEYEFRLQNGPWNTLLNLFPKIYSNIVFYCSWSTFWSVTRAECGPRRCPPTASTSCRVARTGLCGWAICYCYLLVIVLFIGIKISSITREIWLSCLPGSCRNSRMRNQVE